MEQKVLSQDCFDDCFDSVQTCIRGFDVKLKNDESCPLNKCDFSCVDDFPLAMAYVPMQKFDNLYCLDEALCAGTLFKDLDKPFYGGKYDRRGRLK